MATEFYTGGRRSGRTHYIVHRFLATPNSALLVSCGELREELIKEYDVPADKQNAIILTAMQLHAGEFKHLFIDDGEFTLERLMHIPIEMVITFDHVHRIPLEPLPDAMSQVNLFPTHNCELWVRECMGPYRKATEEEYGCFLDVMQDEHHVNNFTQGVIKYKQFFWRYNNENSTKEHS